MKEINKFFMSEVLDYVTSRFEPVKKCNKYKNIFYYQEDKPDSLGEWYNCYTYTFYCEKIPSRERLYYFFIDLFSDGIFIISQYE